MGIYKGASNGWAPLPASTSPLYARANQGFVRISDPNSLSTNGNVVGSSSKNIVVDSGAHTTTALLLILGGSAAS
jgi:hypothetical protein